MNFTLPMASSSEANNRVNTRTVSANECTYWDGAWVEGLPDGHSSACGGGSFQTLERVRHYTARTTQTYRLASIVEPEEEDFGVLVQKA